MDNERREVGGLSVQHAPARPSKSWLPLDPLERLSWEDERLVDAVHAGDDASIAVLLTRYRSFVGHRARAYFLSGGDRDDLMQEGLLGLYKAVRDFDAARGPAFRAFADVCVRRQLISAVKAATRQKHQPLNGFVSLAGGPGEPDLADVVAAPGLQDPADVLVSLERHRALREHLDSALTELETEVLHLHLAGASYAEIGEQLGRGTKTIDNALQRIKRKLEAHLKRRAIAEVG